MKSSKYSILKGWSYAILITAICFMFLFFSMAIDNNIQRKKALEGDEYVSPADGFTIESYHITMYVNDNSLDIAETITVNFTESGHHGIYRTIPQWLPYTNKDGKTESKKAKIRNLESEENYEVETVNGKKKIKIGDPDVTLPIGEHTYYISYAYDMGPDTNEGYDELIFHAFGDYWGTRIKNASLEIHMPKEFNAENNINFFADKMRAKNITSEIECNVENEYVIYANVPDTYDLEKSLTVDIVLPDGYFVNKSSNYGILSFLICVSCIGIGICTIIAFAKKSKDTAKIAETVQFYPPENLDASEIGFLYKYDYGKKLSVALIVELASKGAIKIDESEDKKKITITKTDSKCNLTENEQLVYNQLFKNGDTEELSKDESFYEVYSKISKNIGNKFNDKVYDLNVSKKELIISLYLLAFVFLWGIAYFTINDLNPKFNVLYAISAVSLIVTDILDWKMTKKNTYGEQISAKIKGFRNFLETAEKEKIEMLVEENPNYFYDILPYAYVLGVSKKWIEKFENIPIPNRDMGNFDYTDIYVLDSISSSIPSSSSSSSGCGGGGGCSSCGGGGSW